MPLFQEQPHSVATMDKIKEVTSFLYPRQTPHGVVGWSTVVCDCGISWGHTNSLFVEY